MTFATVMTFAAITTFATIMLEEGVPMRVVAEPLGHSATRITEQTHSHVTARLKAEAGAAVERGSATH